MAVGKLFIYCSDIIFKLYQSSYSSHCNFSVESKLNSLYYRYVIKFSYLSFLLIFTSFFNQVIMYSGL